MSFTQTQIDTAFLDLGLALPPTSELSALEGISDYDQGVGAIVELPQVQMQVAPVVQMFDLALGHAPNQETLASIVSSELTEPQLATAFVTSQAFADVYNNGTLADSNSLVSPELIDALFIRALGHAPTSSTVEGFGGLTVSQAFLAFVTSQAASAAVAGQVETYMTQAVELGVGVLSHDTVQIVGQSSLENHIS